MLMCWSGRISWTTANRLQQCHRLVVVSETQQRGRHTGLVCLYGCRLAPVFVASQELILPVVAVEQAGVVVAQDL